MAAFHYRRFPAAISALTTPARVAACVAVTLLTLAGCGTPGGARSGGHAAGTSAWQLALDHVRPNGTVDVATALSAFTLAVGPVPGAHPVAGPPQPIPSGTIAVQWVLGHWRQLTAHQRTAVLADLGAPARVTASHRGGMRPASATLDAMVSGEFPDTARASRPLNPDIPCLTSDSSGAASYRAQADGIEQEVAANVGAGPFSPDVYFAVNSRQLEGKSLMYTYGCTGSQVTQSGPVQGCTIHINPSVSAGNFSAADIHDFLIHELVHCYLFTHLGAAYYSMPTWYVEGVPSWAMNELGSGSDKESSFWVQYLDTPGTPVFQRSYAAIGFFVHLAETGTDVWHKILPMGEAIIHGGNAAGWAAADPGQAFLDSWGPGYAAARYPGAAWQTGGPHLPHYEGPVPQMSVGDGQTITVRSPAVAVAIAHVDINAQVVRFSGTGNGLLSLDNGSDTTLADAAGAVYTTSGQTQCPSSTAGAGTDLTPLRSGMHYVGLAGGLSAAAVTVSGQSLQSYCATRHTSCFVGTWVSTHERASVPGVLTEGGGAGVRMRISADGSFVVAFTGMAPIGFTADPGGTMEAQGSFTLGGRVTGQATLPSGGQDVLTWAPVPSSLDYSTVTATVHVTSPIDDTIGPMNIADMAGSLGAGGSAIDAHPFDSGTMTCSGDTLVSAGPSNAKASGTWTFHRTGP